MAYEVSGPLFDGQSDQVIRDFCDDAQEIVAARGLEYWQDNMDQAFRNPTPYYETQVLAQKVSTDLTIVHDRRIAYGPWLEDGGSRSDIFPGYHSLARAYRSLQRDVPQLIEGAKQRMIARLNGAG